MAMQVRNRLDSLKKSLSLTASIGHEKIKLWQIQPILDEDQIIVDYLICDAEIIFYIIDNKELTCLKFEYELDKKIVQFHEVLQNPNSSLAEFKTLSNAIYTAILEPISKLKPKARNLYIIPDQQLNYVSFDVLISDLNGVSWQDLSYVLKKYTVSYGFSLRSLLEEAAQSTTRERKNYVGFAPNFTSFPELPTLSTAQMAVKKGRKIFGGSNFLDQESTYENLRIHGQFCSILQLYTHAVVVIDGNYKSSYIYLADRKMYVNEILAMPMDVDLCLLTACDVGLGKHHASEGLTGVAWAFRGAGAKNIVQAMWKINENSSATLIESLFTELNNQQLSTHALRNAKLSFLQSSEISNRMKHPHYWAGMNHYGKGVIIPKRNHWWNWVAMAFGMAIIAGLIIWRNAAIKLKLKTSEMHAPSL
ncbi:MAG: CHAT domain-containing protein [Bacteroidia bacterium]|jgi:CHAT domain-containing protein